MTRSTVALAAARDALAEAFADNTRAQAYAQMDRFTEAMFVLADDGVLDQEPGAAADENFDNITKWFGRVTDPTTPDRDECHAKLAGLLDKLGARIADSDTEGGAR